MLQGREAILERFRRSLREEQLRKEKALQTSPGGLLHFIRYFWPQVEPARPLIEGWPLHAICDHLEAVYTGNILRLCINIPPGFMKSLAVNVFFPAWVWGPMEYPSSRWIAASYSQSLTVRDNIRFRGIIMSPEYRALYGEQFGPSKEQFNIVKVANDRTGWKLATSVGGVGTGERGDFFVIDDGNSVKEAESELVLAGTNQWYTEVVPTRLNDLTSGAIINVQQRSGEKDITGTIIERKLPYEFLRIPMEFETRFPKVPTFIGWTDPREEDGELAWEERFSRKAVDELKVILGPYAVAGQLQQYPAPRGGGILKEEWWQLWNESHWPVCELKICVADTAYTEKEENDPTGCVVLGVFKIGTQHHIILMDAWRMRLELHVPKRWIEKNTTAKERFANVMKWKKASWSIFEKLRAESHGPLTIPPPVIEPEMEPWKTYIEVGENSGDRWPAEPYEVWTYRTQKEWGLSEWLAHSCRKFNVHLCLIEAKASGISVAQEIRRMHGTEGWQVLECPISGDKVARAIAVQGTLSAGLVYAPDREYADMVIKETRDFPKGRYKDLTDALTLGLKYIRDHGYLVRPEERMVLEELASRYKPSSKALYGA